MKILKHFIIITVLMGFSAGLVAQEIKDKYPGYKGKPGDYDKHIEKEEGILPYYFSWMDLGGVTPAKDQGHSPVCWAFAAVAAMESKIKICYAKEYDLSEQYIISCFETTQTPCYYAGDTTALEFFTENQPILEKDAKYECIGESRTPRLPSETPRCPEYEAKPHLPYKGADFYNVDLDFEGTRHIITLIKLSILKDGPAVAGVVLCENFDKWWKNPPSPQAIYCANCNVSPASFFHILLIVGWDNGRGAFLCKNSMGEDAGPNQDGTFWLAYPGEKCKSGGTCHKNVINAVSNMSIIKVKVE